MKKKQPGLKIIGSILIIGVFVIVIILMFDKFNSPQGLEPIVNNGAYPVIIPPTLSIPQDTATNEAEITPIREITITPYPLTPIPTNTLTVDKGPTPLPLLEPADNPSGKLVFSTIDEYTVTIFSLNVDQDGEILDDTINQFDDVFLPVLDIYPSPNGERLALIMEWGNIGIFNTVTGKLESDPLYIGSEGEFLSWYPDNEYFLYNSGFLMMTDYLQSDKKIISATSYSQILSAVSSPDGLSVVFTYTPNDLSEDGIWIVDITGQNLRLLYETPTTSFMSWSPDGNKLAYYGGNFWEIINKNGENHQAYLIEPANCYKRPPQWSPDSRKIVFVYTQLNSSYCTGDLNKSVNGTGIGIIDTESGEIHYPLKGINGISPTWSPDGSKIAFISDYSGSPEVWIMNSDGTGLQQATQNNLTETFVYWSR